MTEIETYQEYIWRRHNTFYKAVIQYTTIGKNIRLRQRWERGNFLDYVTNEKFIQFAGSELDKEYHYTICDQIVLLSNAALVVALFVLTEQTQEERKVRRHE